MFRKIIFFSLVLTVIGLGLLIFDSRVQAAGLITEEAATIQAINKVMASTVSIVAYQDTPSIDLGAGQSNANKTETGEGTGFIVSSDGLIVTNKHVANKPGDFKVFLNDGSVYPAQVLKMDPVKDLALLKIEAKNLPVVKLGDSDKLQVGQTVLAIGNALGRYQNSVTKGIVSGLSRFLKATDITGYTEQLEDVVQTDAAINVGNSGGPLINLKGEVIGVDVAIESNAQSIGFAVPVNEVAKVMASYKKYNDIKYAFLGVRYQMIDGQIKEEYGLTESAGAFVISDSQTNSPALVPDSPAARAGIEEGDVIVSVNNLSLNRTNSLSRILLRFWPGDKVILKLKRDNQSLTKTLVLAERPVASQ